MSTLSGGPRPDDFDDDDVLTAALFKEATQFWVTDDVPSDGEGKDGDVVFVLKEEELSAGGGGSAELPGLGGWAEITDVDGSPKRYAYPDPANPEWVAFEWTDTSKTHTLTTQAGGLVETLLVGHGYKSGDNGQGGSVAQSIIHVSTSENIDLAAASNSGNPSHIGSIIGVFGGVIQNAKGAGEQVGGAYKSGYVSSFTGVEVTYGAGAGTVDGPGMGSRTGVEGRDGCIIVRVPAAQAEKVDPGKWVTRSNYFAVVENGVVTETYTEHHYGNGTVTPLPQTDLIPCDANVTEGYSYENGEFVAPPAPEIPAAQQEILDKINELQKDLEELTK